LLLYLAPQFSLLAQLPADFCTLSLHDALPISLAQAKARTARLALTVDGVHRDDLHAKDLLDGDLDLCLVGTGVHLKGVLALIHQDRKSTRLNSSHVKISYAVFCLKKKKIWLTE